MDERQRTLGALPARSVRRLVVDLAALRRRADAGEDVRVPLVTLHLSSGRDISGWIVDVADSPQGSALVVQAAGPGARHPTYDAVYLEVGALEGLTVHDAPAMAHLISEGKVAAAATLAADLPPPPTRFEVKRKLADCAHKVSAALEHDVVLEVEWDGVPEAGEPLRQLATLIADTAQAMQEVAADAMGKSALVGKIERVRLREGAQAGAHLEGGALIVTARLAFGPQGRLGSTALKQAIERIL